MKYRKGNANTWKNLFTSKDEAWRTPPYVFDFFNKIYKFTFDVAASPYNALCKRFFTKHENALEKSWCTRSKKKDIIWLNPPYSRNMYPWIEKAYQESKKGCTVGVLVFARTDTKWWHEIVLKHAYKIHFIKGRIRFHESKTGKPAKNLSPAPSCLIIFKRHRQKHPIIESTVIPKPKKKHK